MSAKILYITAFSISLLLLVSGCKKVPDYVIGPEEMALLMADIHIGESVAELNRNEYNTDSLKQSLKQSIYIKHGVTPQQVDTSFVWYGHNIDEYMAVYERTIEILEQRIDETGNQIAAEASMSIAGDSVDVWTGSRFVQINNRVPSLFITFSISRDPNWEPGDSYTWRAKLLNGPETSRWTICVDYSDGSTEVLNTNTSGDGWKEVTMFTDSTRIASRIHGTLEMEMLHKSCWLDSIALVRNRLNTQRYPQRYRQKLYR